MENKKPQKVIKVSKFEADHFLLRMYQNLLFEQPLDIRLAAFYATPVGELFQAIPFNDLIKHFPAPKKRVAGKGCTPWFDLKGGIALQILSPICVAAMLC